MSNFGRNSDPVRLPFKITPRLIVVVIVVAIILIAAVSSFFVVDATEEAVVTTLGKYSRVETAGLRMKMPFGIEQNYNVQTQRVQSKSFGGLANEDSGYSGDPSANVMLTGDLNIVEVEWTILYRITDVKKWLFAVDDRQKTIEDISRSVVSELVGDRTISEVIGAARSNIQDQAAALMNGLFDKYNLGITVTQVQLQNVNPPVGTVQAAFQDVNKATQDMERSVNEGKERYNTEIPKARGAAQQVVQQAEGYAAERVNEAQGDVARFNSVLQQYRVDPKNTRIRLYNEMIEDVFGDAADKSVLLDKSLKNAIPLLNLNKSNAVQPSATAGANQ